MFKNIITSNEIKRELSGKIILFAEVFNKSDQNEGVDIIGNSKEFNSKNNNNKDNKMSKSPKKDLVK
jgi:hypothetical protein